MNTPSPDYIVFARKYRPQTLQDVVGQESLVASIAHAMTTNSLSHAILLHGIRGVGKTTTARIIAKGLNCESGPTQTPCGTCSSCKSIAQDAHLDVIEMDAASHTGVDDIRELIETAKYRAVQGRYKIYIIDEVHMLSKSAFNALLKTLEEPPPSVKFIFATTEIKKIPDTILSRCMRFDLLRMDHQTIQKRIQWIADTEGFSIDEDAKILIARAAEGSMRDALSLLDQAYLLGHHTHITGDHVRAMLGLSSKDMIYDVLRATLSGDVKSVFAHSERCFAHGGDALCLLKDILDALYTMICIKNGASQAVASYLTQSEHEIFQTLCDGLPLPSLLQVWTILNDRYDKIYKAPNPDQAFQMALLQVCYAAQIIDPRDVNTLTAEPTPKMAQISVTTTPAPLSDAPSVTAPEELPPTFDALLIMLKDAKELMTYAHLHGDVVVQDYDPNAPMLSFYTHTSAPAHFEARLKDTLKKVTGHMWRIQNLGPSNGRLSYLDKERARTKELFQKAQEHPMVQDMLQQFPGAVILPQED